MASRLAIYDLKTGETQTVLTDPDIIEAPNWLPDNSGLLVNKEGALFFVPFDEPKLRKIDTGFANRLNNDHGISPDGKTIVISDSTENGQSCIYTLSREGGSPKKITQNTPSYWHGWSPDGKWLTYTAKRGPVFDIHLISASGGEEIKLTHGFEHCDGPDYSRDGKWIYFNGEKDGKVDIWRISHDGNSLEQITSNDRVDWFPHPNPVEDTVLYISYEPGVKQHPRDLPVRLELLNLATGKTEVLYEMIGGQGSINTPCWAPDGQSFAFVETV